MRANCKVMGGFLTARGSVTLISMLLKVNLCVCVERKKGEGEEREGGEGNEEGERVRENGVENERFILGMIHTVVEAGKSKVCRIDWQPGDPEKELQ